MTIPYEGATSGIKARDEIVKILRSFGCESIGFMDDFEKQSVFLAFKHRGRTAQIEASAKGWAQLYIKTHPWRWRSRGPTKQQYEERALKQGLIAVNSILRDLIKGQVTAVECGILSFEAVFTPYMLARDGKPMLDHVQRYLEPGVAA